MSEDLLDRINHFGIENQKRKFGEEADELKEAIFAHELTLSVQYEIPLTEIIGTRQHIAEEIVDNLALLRQFQLYYEITDEEIYHIFVEKNERTKKRIEEKYYEKNKNTICE